MKNGYLKIAALIGIFSLSAGITQDLTAQTTFSKFFGEDSTESGRSVEVLGDGSYVVVGEKFNGDSKKTDMYLLKLDTKGNLLWEKNIGGSADDFGYSVNKTSDGGLVLAGYTRSSSAGSDDAFIVKTSLSGTVLWQKSYGGVGRDRAQNVRESVKGGLISVGYSNSPGAKFFDGYLQKLTSDGTEVWKKYFGGTDYDVLNSFIEDSDGNLYAVGQTRSLGNPNGAWFVIATDSEGGLKWQKAIGGSSVDEAQYIQLTNDGNLIITGDIKGEGSGEEDIQIVKMSKSGEIIWKKIKGGTGKDVSKSIEQTSDGGFIIGGISRVLGTDNPNFWIIKTDDQGNTEWNHIYGGYNHEHCYQARQVKDGGYIAVGHNSSENPSKGEDVWAIKLNRVGTLSPITGLSDVLASDDVFIVFPNPAVDDVIHVMAPNKAIKEPVTIQLYNVTGQLVYEQNFNELNAGERVILNTFSHPQGIYFIQLVMGATTQTIKVIKN